MGNDTLATALDVARRFAADPSGSWLYLAGRTGCGKSHLLAAVTCELVRRDIGAYYVFVPKLLDRLRNSFDRGADETFAQVWERIEGADVLVLDDLGAEHWTGWAVEKLTTLIDDWYRERKPLAIASNLAADQLPARIASRVQDRRLVDYVEITAGDYRLRD